MRPITLLRRIRFVLPMFPAISATLLLVLSSACTDGDIREGCRKHCDCRTAQTPAQTCRQRCEDTLTALKKRDRPRAKQVADCLAAKGKRACAELSLCAQGVL